MEFISLAVTQPLLNHVQLQGAGGRQIAIQSASPELHAKISATNRNQLLIVVVGGEFELQFGDPGAVWPRHQAQGMQSDDFDSLYNFLSLGPDCKATFSGEESQHP
jgi:hypothetical protein